MSDLRSGAEISDDGLYRYRLWRNWAEAPPMTFIMLNPSTADANVDDPTIRRCIGFAKREGCGGVVVVNLFAYRATKPDELLTVDDPVGPANIATLEGIVSGPDPIVVAWGAWVTSRLDLVVRVPNVLVEVERAFCLGTTKAGAPRHPLYVKADQPLEVFRAR